MNKIALIFSFILLIVGCEKNDLCTENNIKTPSVNIQFYDYSNNTENKTVELLHCHALGKDEVKIFTNQSKIQLPLKVNHTQTVWVMKKLTINGADTITQTNTLHIHYQPQLQYISKACGYKTIFKNIKVTIEPSSANGWISSLQHLENITNQDEDHIKLYF